MITRNQTAISDGLLRGILEEFLAGAERRQRLRDAYENKRAISRRQRDAGMPNHRLAHGYGRYITTMASGYLLGKPVQYQAEDEAGLKPVLEAYGAADIDSVDAELAKNASIYGRGVEMLYADEWARPRTASVSPESAFVVYDASVAARPWLGVHFAPCREPGFSGYTLTVATAEELRLYRVQNLIQRQYGAPEVRMHFFGGVPVIEYWNDESETGDFEQVLSLMDAYDLLESDRVNDKEQFVDAMLVITGARMEVDERGRTPGQQLREDRLLYLPDREAGAAYLSRVMEESQVEVLRKALREDIHKFSMVPDLTDEQFAGNSSGVAMKFKLLGLEQLVRIKERWFREALRERLRRFSSFLSAQGAPALDADAVQCIFTRSLPVNDLEISQILLNYSELVPHEQLLEQVPFLKGR